MKGEAQHPQPRSVCPGARLESALKEEEVLQQFESSTVQLYLKGEDVGSAFCFRKRESRLCGRSKGKIERERGSCQEMNKD